MRHALLFLACASILAAQEVTLKGIVTDAATGIPVANAKVALRPGISNADLDSVSTGATGTFALTVKESGTYGVAAISDGYSETVNRGIVMADAEFEPGATAVNRNIELKLQRATLLTGRVRDGESRQPISRVVARAIRLWWWHGERMTEEKEIVFTDEDGVFRIEDLPPAEYVLMLGNTLNYAPVGDDRRKAYPVRLWTDGDPESVIPLVLRSGMQVDVGTIDYTRIVPPHIHAPACDGQSQTDVTLELNIAGAWFNMPAATSGHICNELGPIPVLSRGTYRVRYLSQSTGGLGSEILHIRDGEDAVAKVKIQPPVEVITRVTCECERLPESKQDRIRIDIDVDGIANRILVSEDGAPSGEVSIAGEAQLAVNNIPDGFVLKRTLVDGIEAPGSANVHAGTTFEIVLSDRPASITGVVTRDKPVAHDRIVVAKWPGPPGANYLPFASADVTPQGNFTIGKLAPGKYRVTAIGPEQWERRDLPNAVAEWLGASDDIELAPSETKTIQIEAKLP